MSVQRIAFGLAVVAVLAIAWNLLHPVHTYRFRLTLDVRKNGTVHSGSSVIELRTRRNFFLSKLTEAPEWETSVSGEAVFVDLGGGDHVFALLEGPNEPNPTASLPSRAILGDAALAVGSPGVLDKLSITHGQALGSAIGRSYRLSEGQMPALVRFARLDDPTSVERVEPCVPGAGEGGDACSISAHLAITTDEVSERIGTQLPWLDRLRPGKSLRGSNGASWRAGQGPFSSPDQITFKNFKAERGS